jgi:hypothetical protein
LSSAWGMAVVRSVYPLATSAAKKGGLFHDGRKLLDWLAPVRQWQYSSLSR